MSTMTHELGIKNIIFAWLIPLSCILFQYNAIISTYGLLILTTVALIAALERGCIEVDKDLLKFCLLLIVQQIVSYIIFNGDYVLLIKNALNVLLIVFSLSIAYADINSDYIYNNYKVIGIICVLIALFQFVSYYAFDIPIEPISIFSLSEENLSNWVSNSTRPCSFFSEPQTMCSYLLPLLILSLDKREFKIAIFMTLGFLITGSSLGIMIVAVLWVLVLLQSDLPSKRKIEIIVMAMIIAIVFLTIPFFLDAREKVLSVLTDFLIYSSNTMINAFSYSNYLRLVKGWTTFFELPLSHKIIGIGMSNFKNYLYSSNVSFSWNVIWKVDNRMAYYYSSAAGVFIECGVLMACYYYNIIVQKIKKSSKLAKMFFIVILIESFLTQIFFNGIFTFTLLMMLIYEPNKDTMHLKIR